ncbi:MAG: radical SAM protein [Candidatus Methanoperedens sp.]|nr:radical SAM protein [Candidatus Methanoperedens sp.]
MSPIPLKTCSYNCIYCQLGRTHRQQISRESFYPREDILKDVQKVIDTSKTDYITFAGDGEPALCKDLGWLIRQCKKNWQIPVAVITNASLLFMKDVRQDLKESDVVLSKLDAGSEDVFRKLNRPDNSIGFEEMLEGQVDFRLEYSGKIWLEVMLVAGLNDSDISLMDIRKAIELIKPDKVYISVPIRPPAEPWVSPPVPERIIRAHEIIGTALDLTQYESGEFGVLPDVRSTILEICSRHPLREEQARAIEKKFSKNAIIDEMLLKNILVRVEYRNISYLLPAGFVRGK